MRRALLRSATAGEANCQDEEKQVAQVERGVKESHAGRPRDLLAVGEVQLLALRGRGSRKDAAGKKIESFEQDGRQTRRFVLEGRRSKRIHGRTQLLELWRQRTSQIRVQRLLNGTDWWASVPSSGPLRESTSIVVYNNNYITTTYYAKSAFLTVSQSCQFILCFYRLLHFSKSVPRPENQPCVMSHRLIPQPD